MEQNNGTPTPASLADAIARGTGKAVAQELKQARVPMVPTYRSERIRLGLLKKVGDSCDWHGPAPHSRMVHMELLTGSGGLIGHGPEAIITWETMLPITAVMAMQQPQPPASGDNEA